MNKGYSVKVETGSREFNKRERLMFADISNANKLDEIIKADDDSPFVLSPADFAVLSVHNEQSENKDYNVYVLIDGDGNKYVTGSQSFWNSFMDIWEVMHEDGSNEEFTIEIYKKESKNYKGKYFLTCSIV